MQCDGRLAKSYRSQVTIKPVDAFMRSCMFQLQQFSRGKVKLETPRTTRGKLSINQPSSQSTLHHCNLKPNCADSSALNLPPSLDRRLQILRRGAIPSPLMPQLGVFSLFKISMLGVYAGLSAGSFHPSALELFAARRLQPFRGRRWVEESRGGERKKRRSETLTLEVCACVHV